MGKKRCEQCGNPMQGLRLCSECFGKSEDGRKERALKYMREKCIPLENGGPCAACVHWATRCDLGLPEAGSAYAVNCPAMLTECLSQ